MRSRWIWVLLVSGMFELPIGLRAEESKPATTAARLDGDMMKRYLLRQVDQATQRWEADYEARTTPEQIAAYQKQSRERLLEALGGLPERTPLNAQTTGKDPA